MPEIEVPMWRRLASGRIVPSSVADDPRAQAVRAEEVPGGGRVYGEQPYGNGQLTPDVAIDLGTDLVLMEVRSGYLKGLARTGSARPRPASRA
jgi:hypothetical protein